MKEKLVGVVGAGTMGRGIAQLFAQAGNPVLVFDAMEGAVSTAIVAIHAMIDKSVEKQIFSSERGAAIKAGIKPCSDLALFASCDIVIEAIIEEIEAKQKLFAQLESIVSDSTTLASNTSSLIVAEIAAKCRRPDRVAGLHFFNPVPLMKVVEIIQAVRTSQHTVEALRELVEATGHRAVIAADQPGFLVNHAGRGLYTEGLRILEEQVAAPEDVDALMREAAGFKMGPFELLDLTGLDVSGKVMESIYEQFHHEPRFRPSSLIRPRVAAGLFGRKSGAGWYAYGTQASQTVEGPSNLIESLPPSFKVWIDPAADERKDIAALLTETEIILVADPGDAALLIIQPWGIDATGYCISNKLDASKTIAVDPLPGLSKRRTLMLTASTTTAARDAAWALFTRNNAKVTVINDSPGFVVQRILATIVNIAANIAQRRIATVPDIEEAVRVGLGYPRGPLSLGDAIGGRNILQILAAMHAQTGDPRYRPSAWLVRRVGLGLPLTTPEALRA